MQRTSLSVVSADQAAGRAAELLSGMALASLGPHGRHHILQTKERAGSAVVSSISGRVFIAVARLDNAVARFLVDNTVLAQHGTYGDGGLLALALASQLVNAALQQCATPALRLVFVEGVTSALHCCALDKRSASSQACNCGSAQGNTASPPPAVRLRLQWSDLPCILALVRGVVAAKQVCGLTSLEVDKLCIMLVRAFIASVPDKHDGNHLADGPCVRIQEVLGQQPTRSQLVVGVVLDTPLSHEVVPFAVMASVPTTSGLNIAVFNVALDVQHPEQASHASDGSGVIPEGIIVDFSNEAERFSFIKAQMVKLKQLAAALKALDVHVVASQKVIHPALQAHFLLLGILPLERLSARHILPVARCTGAQVISNLSPDADLSVSLGRVGGIRVEEIGHKRYLLLTTCDGHAAAAPVSTLLLCARNDIAMQETMAVCESALKVLHLAVESPWAVEGGGCTEALLAKHIKSKHAETASAQCYSEWPTRHRHALRTGMKAVATALESISQAIQGRRAQQEWEHSDAQQGDGDEQGKTALDRPAVIDLVAVKSSALQTAVEAAALVLQTDDMIRVT
eukprot:jgi/Chlat1/111/Chrsp1S03087